MLQGITNLATSAASVHLSAIEQMAMNLLPMLHEVGRQDLRQGAEAINKFQEGVARISTAVHRLTSRHQEERILQSPNGDDSAIEARCFDALSTPQQVTTPQPAVQSSEASEPPLLKALRALQQTRARSVQTPRDVLGAVILRAGHEAGEIDVLVIERILKELDRLDEQFLEDVNRRVPIIIQALRHLQTQETTDPAIASQLDPIVGEVDALRELANRVHASTMTMFLDGLRSFVLDLANHVQASKFLPRLRSFLPVKAHNKPSTLRQRLEMVEARVRTLIPMAEEWVTLGQTERADIGEILRASPDGRAVPPYNPTTARET